MILIVLVSYHRLIQLSTLPYWLSSCSEDQHARSFYHSATRCYHKLYFGHRRRRQTQSFRPMVYPIPSLPLFLCVINVNGLVFSIKEENMNSFLFGPIPFTKTRVVSRCGHGGLHPYAIVGNQLLPLLSTSVTLTKYKMGSDTKSFNIYMHRVRCVSPIGGHDEAPIIHQQINVCTHCELRQHAALRDGRQPSNG